MAKQIDPRRAFLCELADKLDRLEGPSRLTKAARNIRRFNGDATMMAIAMQDKIARHEQEE